VSFSITRSVQLDSARVLVIGDLMFDRFCYGSVSRISPEAPVPVVLVNREQAMLGGSGNVLANLCAVGSAAGLIGVIGDDEAGRQCAAMGR
jgi:bifunctional ADP-heptose synthase (sugar kinase/adenylyltransferase)